MTVGMLLLAANFLMLVVTLPYWRYSRTWSFGPSAGYAMLCGCTVLLMLTGEF